MKDQFSQAWRHLRTLLRYFGISYKPTFFKNFKALVVTLMETYPGWCTSRKSLPSLFWMRVLKDKVEMDPDIKQLIRTLLVLPLGSSEAERAFRYDSKINYLKMM